MARSDERFMVDEGVLRRVCDYAGLGSGDVVFEAGAGVGGLTVVVAGYGCRVFAVEKNRVFYGGLEGRFKGVGSVTLVCGDALKVGLPGFNKVVSNIPYSISKQLVRRILLHGFDTAVLVVQKEFAEKLNARAGRENYRMISALTQSSCSVELLEDVPPEAFTPKPNVHSTVVRLRQHSKPTPEYAELLNNLFNHRNKLLKNILPGYGGEYSGCRPYELTPEELRKLAGTAAVKQYL